MGYECFEVHEVGDVAHVVLSRGDALNTMTPAFWRELPQIVDGLSDEGRVRAIVVSSTGRHFTAGMDLSVFAGRQRGDDREAGRGNAHTRSEVLALQESFTALERARMPVLAAVQGGCVGGGVDMVSACDLRYASADAFFVIEETNIGITADLGTLQRLPRLIPEGVARELAYTGRRLRAEEAREVGLVNRVFGSHDELVDGVLAIAVEIAEKSPLAVAGTKRMLNYARDHSMADALDYAATWQAGMLQAADLTEALTAKKEGRAPRFGDLSSVFEGF